MKIKLFLSALMLMVGTLTATYASFPVQRTTSNNTNTTVVVENQEDELSSPAIAGEGKSQIVAAILAFNKNRSAWIPLIIDVVMGLVLFLRHRFYK